MKEISFSESGRIVAFISGFMDYLVYILKRLTKGTRMQLPAFFLASKLAIRSGLASVLTLLFLLLSAQALDENGDGLSDVWVKHYAYTGTAPEDSDGDGQNALFESLAGTNPYAGSSRFETLISATGSTLTLQWQGVLFKRYQPSASFTLQSWSVYGSPLTGAGTLLSLNEPLVGGVVKKFFRVMTLPDFDSDGEGLNDYEEGLLGTNRLSVDSDGEGGDDAYEFINGLNPALADETGDLDGDGVINAEDARPKDAGVGRIAFEISYPSSGGSIP